MLDFEKVNTPEALTALADTANEIWHEYFPCILTASQIDYMVDKFQSEHAMREQMKSKGYEYYLVKNSGVIIGYVGLVRETEKLFLSKLYLKKDKRGKGYAGMMFEFIFGVARENGLKSVYLTVNRHNDHSVAVYEYEGFIKAKTQVTDIGDGFVMDDFVMEKTL